jgi:uncharacterized protein (TIGR02145 family)
MSEQIINALKDIRDKCGEDIFNNEKRFKGAICDVLLGSDREVIRIRKRLIDTVELGAYNRLKLAAAKNEIQMGCSHLVTELHNEGIDEDVAQDIIKSFAALFTTEEIFIQQPQQKRIEIVKIETVPNPNTFTDPRDGKVYRTVKIGNQVWMAENLNFDCPGSKCYGNYPNAKKYGRLYDWATAKKACPPGWHLPSKEEWQILVDFAGSYKFAGKKLKAKSGWNKNGNGTDEFDFSALPGGYGYSRSGDRFYDVGDGGYWWSASEYSSYYAYGRYMLCISDDAYWDDGNNDGLFSVRCVQDKA